VVVRSGQELTLSNLRHQTCSSAVTPFTGTLTNKVSFKQTGKSKSPTSSTAFNNITLSLPQRPSAGWIGGAGPVTLETLLQMYVSTESVHGGVAESGIPAALVKQLTFARLPDCLCFHIQRTAFENGISFKRSDSVLFPTILNMDNYAYNRQMSKMKAIKSTASVAGSTVATPAAASETPDCTESSCVSWMLSPDDGSIPPLTLDSSGGSFNNNYALRAVVVHLGGIDSGHYVTYRREPQCPVSDHKEQRQWFYSSDSLIKEVTVEDVLKTNPYMLFYEKIHPATTQPLTGSEI